MKPSGHEQDVQRPAEVVTLQAGEPIGLHHGIRCSGASDAYAQMIVQDVLSGQTLHLQEQSCAFVNRHVPLATAALNIQEEHSVQIARQVLFQDQVRRLGDDARSSRPG